MSDYGPLYSDRNKSPINYMLVLGLGAGVMGLFAGGTLTVIGLAVAVYSWFTTPTAYHLYNDRILVVYGRPRVRHVMYENIQDLESLMVPLSGLRIRVREYRGRGVWLTPRDPSTFVEQYRIAKEQFDGTRPPEPEREPDQESERGLGQAYDSSSENATDQISGQGPGPDSSGDLEQKDPWGDSGSSPSR